MLLAGTKKMTAFYGAVIEIPADTQLDITLVGSAVPGRIKAIPASIMPYFSPGVAGAITKGKAAHISCRYIQQPGNSYKYVSIVLAHTLFQAEGLSSCGSSAGASRNILKTASAIAPAVSRSVRIWLISFAKAISSADGWVRKEGYR